MRLYEFPQEMIDAVVRLKSLYETPNPKTHVGCPLCIATLNDANSAVCRLCPHVVIDGADESEPHDDSPCSKNPSIPNIDGGKAYVLQHMTDEAYSLYNETSPEQVAAVRRAHIARCDRWLEVMVPVEDESPEDA